MRNHKETIRKMVGYLNNEDKDGGFWLPNIQRPFVWHEDQIERLFDSIMREYPISTLLVWKTANPVRMRRFIADYKDSLNLTDFYVPDTHRPKMLVLDGQQRLQSFYIGLKGSYDGRELYFNLLSGEQKEPEDVRFVFKFIEATKARLPWVRVKDIVASSKAYDELAESLIEKFEAPLSREDQRKIRHHIAKITKSFCTDEVLVYQELDSIDSPTLYREDDVVEVFIRANSGGTRLGKSDLLFSLLISSWDEADQRIDEMLERLNRHGYEFTRDFVLKACLTILDQGARYEVDKFRNSTIRQKIEAEWERIEAAILDVQDFLYGKTMIRCDKALPSYLALIPIIYFRYHFPNKWTAAKDIPTYLVRTLLASAFSGLPDQLIDDCVSRIRSDKDFKLNHIFEAIVMRGRNLAISQESLLASGYGSAHIHLIFSLWYGFNYAPAYDANLPQVDHIFPQSALKKVKDVNPETGRRSLMKYKDADRNQLANCMLLTAHENGAGGKGDMLPSEWFKDKPEDYLELHLIPRNPRLWELDEFENFVKERQTLILKKFQGLLLTPAQRTPRIPR